MAYSLEMMWTEKANYSDKVEKGIRGIDVARAAEKEKILAETPEEGRAALSEKIDDAAEKEKAQLFDAVEAARGFLEHMPGDFVHVQIQGASHGDGAQVAVIVTSAIKGPVELAKEAEAEAQAPAPEPTTTH